MQIKTKQTIGQTKHGIPNSDGSQTKKKFTVQFTCDFGHKSNFTFEYQPCRTIDDTSGQCALENIKLAFLVLVKNFDDGFNYHDIKNTCTIIWCAFAD